MKLFLAMFLILCSVQSWAACDFNFEKNKVCGKLEWIDGPYLGEKSHFEVKMYRKGDLSESPIDAQVDFHFYGWMVMDNGHSHGGPKMTYRRVRPGVYEVRDARFFMHGMQGYWEIRADYRRYGRSMETAAVRVEFDQ